MFHEYSESGPSLLGNVDRKIRAKFRLSPANTTIANTLRRQILIGTPSVGFRTEPAESSEVQIDANTTPLVNEMLAHRIGMIPVAADPHTFDPTKYVFSIHKENDGKTAIPVHADDFVITEKGEDGAEHTVPTNTFFPPDPLTGETCLITLLRPQWNPIAPFERLSLKARAAVSTGAENSRWSPVSQCSFENTLDTNEERQQAMFVAWLAATKKIAEPSAISAERLTELRREYNTMEAQRCFLVNEAGEPHDFTFYLESVGVRSVPDCVRDGIQSCVDMLTRYQDLDGVIPDNVSIQPGDARFPCVDIVFRNEGHTLGNLLQHYLVTNHIEGAEEPRITYAGYKVPHPLKQEMFVRVGLSEELGDAEAEQQTARLVVAKVCRHLKAHFSEMLASWAALHIPPQTP